MVEFFNLTPKEWSKKRKIDKLYQNLNICSAKVYQEDEKKSYGQKKKIFITLFEVLVSRIYKELLKVSEKNDQFRKPAKDAKRH